MTRFAAVFSERREAREQLRRTFPGAGVEAHGLAAAWAADGKLDSARHGAVTCLVAGASSSASGLAHAFAEGRLDLRAQAGGFTVLLWDDEQRRGVVATDRLGLLAPVFRRSGDTLVVALDVRDLLPILPSRPGPDGTALVRWLGSGQIDSGSTLYAGVERLPGGHLLELVGGRWVRRLDRGFEYGGTIDAPRAEVEEELRAAVEHSVAGNLDGERPTGVLLSGGLDSAVVAAEAAAHRRLPAFSLVFPQHPDVDESALISEAAGQLGLDATLLPFAGGPLLPAASDFIAEWELPPASPTLAIQLPLLRLAAARGVTTLLDGQGGDELFGVPLYLLADRLLQARLRSAWELAHRLPGIAGGARTVVARRALREFGLKGALPHGAHALGRRLPGRDPRWAPLWLRPEAAAMFRASVDDWSWKRANGPRWWAGLLDAVTAQRERAGVHEYLRRRNALAGVEGRHPLLQDTQLIELVLRLPPELAFDPSVDRPLLRTAMPRLPEAIRRRSRKAYFTPLLLDAVDEHDAAALRRLLTADDAALREFVLPEVLLAHLLDAPSEQRGEDRASALWRLAVAELWLRHQDGG